MLLDIMTQRLLDAVQQDIERWEEAATSWEDPRILGMDDIRGSKLTGKQMAANYGGKGC